MQLEKKVDEGFGRFTFSKEEYIKRIYRDLRLQRTVLKYNDYS